MVKKKKKTLRSIADLREVNKKIPRKPFPIPKIHELLSKLKGLQHITSPDLNMGYYNIRLTPHASSICKVVLQGKVGVLTLTNGIVQQS
jgi:hypothetical protein